MSQKPKAWEFLSLDYNENIHEILTDQHLASQFVALVGKYLAQQKPDDSNTNMRFIAEKQILLGNPVLNGLQLAFHLADFKLVLFDSNQKTLNEIWLDGKSQEEVFDTLKNSLASNGVDVSNFINKLHYDLPYENNDRPFNLREHSENFIAENIRYRHNAEIILAKLAGQFPNAEPVRIWPHHFDTGSYVPLEFNDKKEVSKSIGIGWAIPDSMVNEPYYYLSFWSEKPIEGLDNLKPLEAGEWKIPDWDGAVLKLSEICKQASAKSQFRLVLNFFEQGIKMLLNN